MYFNILYAIPDRVNCNPTKMIYSSAPTILPACETNRLNYTKFTLPTHSLRPSVFSSFLNNVLWFTYNKNFLLLNLLNESRDATTVRALWPPAFSNSLQILYRSFVHTYLCVYTALHRIYDIESEKETNVNLSPATGVGYVLKRRVGKKI